MLLVLMTSGNGGRLHPPSHLLMMGREREHHDMAGANVDQLKSTSYYPSTRLLDKKDDEEELAPLPIED